MNEDPEVARALKLARWMDDRFLDPLIGLVLPGAGDIITTVVGLYTVRVAVRKKLPAVVVARMLLNLAADALFGSVPIVGDLFDFVHRANSKNADLLRTHAGGRAARLRDWAVVSGAALGLLVAVAAPAALLVIAVSALRS